MSILNHQVDLGSLSVYNYEEIKDESALKEATAFQIQHFFKQLTEIQKKRYEETQEKKLESQFVDYDADPEIVTLPDAEVMFPRFKNCPDKPIMTKWEEFAKRKGIKKNKKDKLVYDPTTEQWLPRFGKDSIRDLAKERDIIRDDVNGEDPFKKDEKEKKIRKMQQRVNETANKLKKKGIDIKPTKADNSKQISSKINKVKESSAGMGQFDLKTKQSVEKKVAKKAQYIEHFKTYKDESKRNQDILSRLI